MSVSRFASAAQIHAAEAAHASIGVYEMPPIRAQLSSRALGRPVMGVSRNASNGVLCVQRGMGYSLAAG